MNTKRITGIYPFKWSWTIANLRTNLGGDQKLTNKQNYACIGEQTPIALWENQSKFHIIYPLFIYLFKTITISDTAIGMLNCLTFNKCLRASKANANAWRLMSIRCLISFSGNVEN